MLRQRSFRERFSAFTCAKGFFEPARAEAHSLSLPLQVGLEASALTAQSAPFGCGKHFSRSATPALNLLTGFRRHHVMSGAVVFVKPASPGVFK